MAASFELVPAGPEHVEALAKICFEAFGNFHRRHTFPPDFPNVEVAQQLIGLLVQREDVYGVAALMDGQPVGSNFISLMDAVSGVGPITVDDAYQGHGIGRALMKAVVDHARSQGMGQIRLAQDAFNSSSMSLYASLGFNVISPLALMEAVPSLSSDESIRPLTVRDLDLVAELGERLYGVSRCNEVDLMTSIGIPAFLREREGRATGYFLPGFLGHGAAETEEDALALIGEAARAVPPELNRYFIPLNQPELFRKALNGGSRVVKLMNYMAMDPYQAPRGVWLPSVLC